MLLKKNIISFIRSLMMVYVISLKLAKG